MKNKKQIRWGIFLIPWILVVATIILNLINGDTFNTLIMTITNFILDKFDWLFALMSFVCVILIVAAYFSPFGNVRIGGRNAKPMMNQTNYIWIVLCTIMAAGILLWACAEPMYHYYNPPGSVTAQSADAITFIMKNSFLEWTFTPMCIYGMPAILFAFLFYNMGKKYSIGSMLFPALNQKMTDTLTPVVDVICLFALVCGMAASMGSAIFLVADGTSSLTGGAVKSTATLWSIIAAIIVIAFVTSAVSGVMNGIRILSTFNSRIYFILGLFVFIFGPTAYILKLTVEGFGAYISTFAQTSLFLSAADGDKWAMWWPIFYWCNWMAWMPVTSTFLGKISRGYSVKEAIRVIVIFPSLFSVAWLGLFSSILFLLHLLRAGRERNQRCHAGRWDCLRNLCGIAAASGSHHQYHHIPGDCIRILYHSLRFQYKRHGRTVYRWCNHGRFRIPSLVKDRMGNYHRGPLRDLYQGLSVHGRPEIPVQPGWIPYRIPADHHCGVFCQDHDQPCKV